jgi:hypothetical protein
MNVANKQVSEKQGSSYEKSAEERIACCAAHPLPAVPGRTRSLGLDGTRGKVERFTAPPQPSSVADPTRGLTSLTALGVAASAEARACSLSRCACSSSSRCRRRAATTARGPPCACPSIATATAPNMSAIRSPMSAMHSSICCAPAATPAATAATESTGSSSGSISQRRPQRVPVLLAVFDLSRPPASQPACAPPPCVPCRYACKQTSRMLAVRCPARSARSANPAAPSTRTRARDRRGAALI